VGRPESDFSLLKAHQGLIARRPPYSAAAPLPPGLFAIGPTSAATDCLVRWCWRSQATVQVCRCALFAAIPLRGKPWASGQESLVEVVAKKTPQTDEDAFMKTDAPGEVPMSIAPHRTLPFSGGPLPIVHLFGFGGPAMDTLPGRVPGGALRSASLLQTFSSGIRWHSQACDVVAVHCTVKRLASVPRTQREVPLVQLAPGAERQQAPPPQSNCSKPGGLVTGLWS